MDLLVTFKLQCWLSRPWPLHALKLGISFIRIGIFGLASPQYASRVVARPIGSPGTPSFRARGPLVEERQKHSS